MNRPLAILVLFGLMFQSEFDLARAVLSKDQFQALYSSMNVTFDPDAYGDGIAKIKRDFFKVVPPADYTDVLAEIIEQSSKAPSDMAVLTNAMNLADLKGPNRTLPWSKRLEAALLPQAGNPNPEIRKRLVNIFLAHPEAEHREVITPVLISLLSDDNDHYRAVLINWVAAVKWPGAKSICDDYVKSNQPEGEHKESVMAAKAVTNPDDKLRTLKLWQMSQHPDAKKTYLDYVALHKNDPDYELSVDEAERLLEAKQDHLPSPLGGKSGEADSSMNSE